MGDKEELVKEILLLHKISTNGLTRQQSKDHIKEYIKETAPVYEYRGSYLIHNLVVMASDGCSTTIDVLDSFITERVEEKKVDLIKS